MKVIPQYKVICPNNYDSIIHNIKKIMQRDKMQVRQMERCIWF